MASHIPSLLPSESGQQSLGKETQPKVPMNKLPNSSSVNPDPKPIAPHRPSRKWLAMAGAGGASLAAAIPADAALVQITQVGNFVTIGNNQISNDFTGDMILDSDVLGSTAPLPHPALCSGCPVGLATPFIRFFPTVVSSRQVGFLALSLVDPSVLVPHPMQCPRRRLRLPTPPGSARQGRLRACLKSRRPGRATIQPSPSPA